MPSSHEHWTGHEIKRLREMRAAGFSATYIALILGRSRNAVLGQIFRLRLPLPPGKTYRRAG